MGVQILLGRLNRSDDSTAEARTAIYLDLNGHTLLQYTETSLDDALSPNQLLVE